jgi:hypothetical protein
VNTVHRFLRGAAAAAILLLLVSCHGTEAQYSVGGDIFGTTVPVVLKLNGGNDIAMNGDGSFKFDQKLLTNDTFNVQVVDSGDRCTVSSGAGTVGKSNITNVSINCIVRTDPTVATLAVVRSASLSGTQETPPVTTNATGSGGLVVIPNATQMPIAGGITFSGFAPGAGPGAGQVNIHLSPSGNIVVPLILAADGLTAVVPPGTTLDPALLEPLRQGNLYFNVATTANPNGEIRGVIQLQGGVAASLAFLDHSVVVPPTGSAATGTGVLFADQATGRLLISYITHNVANATAAAIHTSPVLGTNGASVILFSNIQTNLASPPSTATMSAQNLADFSAGLLYFEVDSATNPNGEIRGNIAPQ